MASNIFDCQPKLEGELLRTRPLLAGDFDALYAVASDPLLWELHPHRERYQRPVFQKFFEEALKPPGSLLILEKSSGEVIGSSRFYDFKPAEDSVCIGYTFFARRCWSGGFNSELKSLMLAHAFKSAGRAIFHVGKINLRSRRAVEKLGAKATGEFERMLPNGTPSASMVYELKREEWAEAGKTRP